LSWWVQDLDGDGAVAPYACPWRRVLLNHNAHDGRRVLGEPDGVHPQIAASQAMAGIVDGELP
jgi:hypothetical protein